MTIGTQKKYAMKLLKKVARGVGLSAVISYNDSRDYAPMTEEYDQFLGETAHIDTPQTNISSTSEKDSVPGEIIGGPQASKDNPMIALEALGEKGAKRQVEKVMEPEAAPDLIKPVIFQQKDVTPYKDEVSETQSITAGDHNGENKPDEGKNEIITRQVTQQHVSVSPDLAPGDHTKKNDEWQVFKASDFKNSKEKSVSTALKSVFSSKPAVANREDQAGYAVLKKITGARLPPSELQKKQRFYSLKAGAEAKTNDTETIGFSVPRTYGDKNPDTEIEIQSAARNTGKSYPEREDIDTIKVEDVFPDAFARQTLVNGNVLINKRENPFYYETIPDNRPQARAGAGTIKIGNINIKVSEKQKIRDEEWPEAPRYEDHIITEDWEWSCHYGR